MITAPHPAFHPLTAGRLHLSSRVVMAPMTRSRAPRTLATERTAAYYAQRAGAGLVVTEGIQPSPVGQGYPDTPGLHSAEHVAAWRTVTDRAHAAGGTIVAQLMHTGRIGHPSTTAASGHGALTPVGPSAVRAAGQVFTPTGLQDHVVPDALTGDQVEATIADFAAAARHAIEAGFDGVEVHGANGYLLHQFLAPNANRRTDAWGGSAEHRVRLPLAVVRAVAEEIGADRTAVRLSPANGLGDTDEPDHTTTYPLLVDALDELGLAYLHLVEHGAPALTPVLRRAWSGVLVLNPLDADPDDPRGRLDRVARGDADAVSFARAYIANPDLVRRLATGVPLAEPDLSLAYGGDEHGYTDYPSAPVA